MSTIATQLNWGSSYLVEDFYRRFLKKDGSEAHYVNASRLATAFLCVAAAVVAWNLTSVSEGWKIVLELGAGTGGVYLLRWYWWRVNAWSEISAMMAALVNSGAAFELMDVPEAQLSAVWIRSFCEPPLYHGGDYACLARHPHDCSGTGDIL
jgi:Na+/proline symporter